MRGSKILLQANPKGTFLEGTMGDTSKPGTIMQVKASTADVGGRPTYVAAAPGTDGYGVQSAVLLEDDMQGFLSDTSYVSGRRCRLYVPIPGEEMNVRVGEVAGTGNTYAVGDRLAIDAEDGILVPCVTSAVCLFIARETLTQVVGNSLIFATKM